MFARLKQPLGIFLLALVIRAGVAYVRFDHLSADPDAYARISETLAQTGVYGLTAEDGSPVPTAYRPPLYPFLLSALVSDGRVSRVGVAVLHVLLGAVTAVLAYLIFCDLTADYGSVTPAAKATAGTLAAGLVIIDPILLQQSTLVMTETLATALATAVIWWWLQWCKIPFRGFWTGAASVTLLGLLLASAYLCRPTFLVWAMLLGFAVACLPWRRWPLRLGAAAGVWLLVAVVVLAWTERNRRVMGHPIWATTHGGYTLLLANNPSFYQYLRDGRLGEVWDATGFVAAHAHRHQGDPSSAAFWQKDWTAVSSQRDRQGAGGSRIDEYEDDQICYQAARATIAREPGMFVWSCVVRLARLWSPFPHRTPDRSRLSVIVVGVYYSAVYVGVFIGLWRLGRTMLLPRSWHIWTLAITLSLVHAIYWSNLRMRAPILPVLAAIAAVAALPKPEPRKE